MRSGWALVIWLAYLAVLGMLLGAIVAAALAPGDVRGRFLALVTSPTFREALLRTHLVAAASTAAVGVLGAAFLMSWRQRPAPGLAILLRAPILLHGFPAALAYVIVFGNAGWLNRGVQLAFGLAQPPLPLLFTLQALVLFFTIFGMPYFLAYAVNAIRPEIAELENAARALGSSHAHAFWHVTAPLMGRSLRAALCLVYVLAAGSLAVPSVIGGARQAMLASEIYGLVAALGDVSQASALALGLMASLVIPLLLLDRGVDWALRWTSTAPPLRPRQPKDDPRADRTSRWLRRLPLAYQRAWLVLLVLLVCTPLVASFVSDWGSGVLPRGWTLRWYAQVDARFWGAMRLSTLLSLGCVLITLAVGLLLAVAWRFGSLPGKGLLRTLVLLPIGVPGFIWGLGLLVLANRWYPPFAHGPLILLAGQSFLALPFMVRVLMSALEEFDTRLLDAAANLGADPIEWSRDVLLPLLLPAVGVGAALVFVRTFGESNLALMVAPTAYPTAPLWLYEAIGTAGIGAASAIEVFLVAVPLGALLVWERWVQRAAPWAQAQAALPV